MRGIALAGAAFLLAAPCAFAASIAVRVEAAPGAVVPRYLRIEAHSLAHRSERSVARGDSTQATLAYVRTGVWRVFVVADGLWAAEQLVTIVSPDETKACLFRLWKAGRVAGRLEPAPPDGDVVDLTFESPPDQEARQIPRARARCPVQGGRFTCELPAAGLDMELSVGGYVSHHRFGARIPAGQTLDLGVLPLRRVASIEGIVKTADGARVGPSGRVRLFSPLGEALRSPPEDGERPYEMAPNERGFYQFVAVPPGPLVVEADKPGWAPSSTPVLVDGPVQVKAPPIVLQKAVGLDLVLRPAQGPDGKPWKVELLSAGARMLAVGEPRAANALGRLALGGLSAGVYVVIVADSNGNRWLSQEIEIPSPAPIEIDVDAVSIAGTVKLGAAPLRSKLFFGGRNGAVRIELNSDDEGQFRGALPTGARFADWQVFVSAKDPPVTRTFTHLEPQVDVTGEARLDIVIPDVRLRGRVLSDRGEPLQGIVNIQSLDELEQIVQARTDSAGYYDVTGLPAGRAIAIFRGRGISSAQTPLALKQDRPTEYNLIARPFVPLRGRVLDTEGQPVAGAEVFPFPRHWTKLWMPPPPASTRPDGAFEVGVPFDSRQVLLCVRAPGYAMAWRNSALGETPEITIDRYGGMLVVDYPRIRSVDFYKSNGAYLVFGTYTELLENPLLQKWSHANLVLGEAPGVEATYPSRDAAGPTTLVLPQMAPGPYSVCVLKVRDVLDIEKGKAPPAGRCQHGSDPPSS